ncbi:thermonuclease family protein [Peptococcus simiae]|uniref:Thermonuclease family protein n=1 Tax=Peptococcus simiae TaxID=1643805 RepID=A0ABW9H128_9FIRM
MRKTSKFIGTLLCLLLLPAGYISANTDILNQIDHPSVRTVQKAVDTAKSMNIIGERPKATGEYVDQLTKASVVKVVDGDTLLVEIKGVEYKVRLIGVDTPEVYGKQEYYGREASDYVKSILKEGQEVFLERDVSDTDRYGRLLRYVWINSPISNQMGQADVQADMVNGILVSEGYAAPATFPPDVKYEKVFADLSKQPRKEGFGLWKNKENRETGRAVALV